MTPAGFPHSDIPGSKLVCSSPRLIAAYHVLRRLLVPRHPPCALSSLTGNTKVLQLCIPSVSYSIVKERRQWIHTAGEYDPKIAFTQALYDRVNRARDPLSIWWR